MIRVSYEGDPRSLDYSYIMVPFREGLLFWEGVATTPSVGFVPSASTKIITGSVCMP